VTAAELLVGITVWIALASAVYGVQRLLRHVLDPAAREWLTRCDAAAGRLSRGLSSLPPGADLAAPPRTTGVLATGTAQPQPAGLR
jgi:hypothetical protein